jgi:hypothetical protein
MLTRAAFGLAVVLASASGSLADGRAYASDTRATHHRSGAYGAAASHGRWEQNRNVTWGRDYGSAYGLPKTEGTDSQWQVPLEVGRTGYTR